jgi:hypothetical protein
MSKLSTILLKPAIHKSLRLVYVLKQMRTFYILISLRIILINASYLCPQSNLFAVDCVLTCSVHFSLLSRCATCFAHIILLDLLILITSGRVKSMIHQSC